jgi:predicted kinase
MPTLTITRGLPASGKSTWAREQLRQVALRAARINRDDLRRTMHDGFSGAGWAERQVTIAQHAAIAALLRSGVDVICDDTNLRSRVVRDLVDLAADCHAEFVVEDFTDVPVDVCVERDRLRDPADRVGEEVIRDMHQRYLADRPSPLPVPVSTRRSPGSVPGSAPPSRSTPVGIADAQMARSPQIYRPTAGLPEAILVDIDGTVALLDGRDPYDMRRVGDDQPNPAVITAVRAMHAFGHQIVYCTGRTDYARTATEAWLKRHVDVHYEALFMRRTGDTRRDSVVKAEIFEREIRHRFQITGVFDDRAQVVRMWRALGLTVFQVAEGDF